MRNEERVKEATCAQTVTTIERVPRSERTCEKTVTMKRVSVTRPPGVRRLRLRRLQQHEVVHVFVRHDGVTPTTAAATATTVATAPTTGKASRAMPRRSAPSCRGSRPHGSLRRLDRHTAQAAKLDNSRRPTTRSAAATADIHDAIATVYAVSETARKASTPP